jgi:nicotinate-nucleotide adenylyltransferase
MARSVARRKAFIAPPGPIAPGLKIGLLGGSFNPAHEGHCHVSAVAMKRLGLDYVWWMVAPQNPLKPVMGMAPLDNRLRFARAHAKHPRLLIMDIERDIGTRYTIDTLKALQRRFPQVHFVWLMGSDNLASLHRWRCWQDIVRRIPVAVVMRPGTVLAPLKAKAAERFARYRVYTPKDFARRTPPALIVLDGPRNRQSSTAIRTAWNKSQDLVAAMPTC